jgi:hypothetical protein
MFLKKALNLPSPTVALVLRWPFDMNPANPLILFSELYL